MDDVQNGQKPAILATFVHCSTTQCVYSNIF